MWMTRVAQNSNENIENSNSCDRGPGGSIQEFWEFYKINFGLDPKTFFILMTCSGRMQSYKKIDVRKKLFQRLKYS
jgi:hypothetical protein